MKIEDLSRLEIPKMYTNGVTLTTWQDGLPFAKLIEGYHFVTAHECRQVAALFRASAVMLDALKEAVKAHDTALSLTIEELETAGQTVEYLEHPEWYQKCKQAIAMAENTNELL